MKIKKLTQKALNQVNVYNSHNLCAEGGGRVYIEYLGWDPVSGMGSEWLVQSVDGSVVDPKSHWARYGAKVFSVWKREVKPAMLENAKAWAGEKYGITEWVRDPFGGWQDADVYRRVLEKAQAHGD